MSHPNPEPISSILPRVMARIGTTGDRPCRYCGNVIAYSSVNPAWRVCNECLHARAQAASKRRNGHRIPPALRDQIIAEAGGRCELCCVGFSVTASSARDSLSNMLAPEIDHIVPICQGGETVRSNLRALCRRCNRSKGGR
jgi:5-methylcytosine-specific restriction endonuclease McrA